MRRDLTAQTKRADLPAKRARALQVPRLTLIDATTFDWAAFRQGNAETRERMRQEYDGREATLVAEQNAVLPEGEDSLTISAIVVRV